MITSFRMYEVVPAASAAWRALFERVFRDTGLDIGFLEHKWPQPIAELWAREDLCAAFMCGWPFVRSRAVQPIAAPVPSPPRYRDLPRYCSEFLVREASGWTTLEETFGHRIGWMAGNSQSGFNAPRAHLARFATPERPALYSESLGPLGSPLKALDAVREGMVDVTALDGFFLDLLRHHDPAKLEGLRTVATTPWTPIPLLVAAPAIPAATVRRLRDFLVSLEGRAGYEPLLREVLLRRFVTPDVDAYECLEAMARDAERRGYAAIR